MVLAVRPSVESTPSVASTEFETLLTAATAGTAWAWQQLFDDLSPAIAGYLRVQGAVEVDDLVSEVFIGVYRRIGSFVGTHEQFRSWVFVIAHHKLIDERRRRSRTISDPVAELTEPCPPGPDAATAALEQMSLERVIELTHRLVPDQRDVLLLRIVGDLTIHQIADVVGKSEGAVKALQRRGLAALQRIFSEQGVPR